MILVTYHSLHLLAEELETTSPDMVCFDEAHHMVEAGKAAAIDDVMRLSKRCYFFTATPTQEMRDRIGVENELSYLLPAAINSSSSSARQ